ncbi:RNA-guided pseudouridylation complex pseudouridine synthase subunit Cbf5 [Candidatus Micrarchaeota archaeon]|nr:RNA-guided pseudouridylation complex pseudouridine synthase subunit Cbf5 [Candidatus Micrarchaeota archaeon]MBU1681943.1 RNA-guided pseudouridylation complex pseudouridine synthase subunit Cbf5 [Candidatus Micrarchaeota archaeon]
MKFNNVIILDKPPGHTSHEITTFVKKITGASRAGHAGTLDPQVSGVLPIALGRATKLLRYIAGADKTYVGIIKFKKVQTKKQIESLFSKFTGVLIQTPPKKSAVRKRPRKRTVHYLKFIEIDEENPRLVLFETKVDAGTYIRTLCKDIGKKCGGARMEELRRTAVGEITEDESFKIYELIDAVHYDKEGKPELLRKMLRTPEEFVRLPKVFIKESALESIKRGAQIMIPAIEDMEEVEADKKVAIYYKDRFVGVGIAKITKKELNLKKGLGIKLERVHL